MYLDKRSEKIVQYLIYHTGTDNRELMDNFSLSRNQLNYSIKKINEWCRDNNISEVKRFHNGHFYVPEELLEHMKQEQIQDETATDLYILSENERANIILLMIFAKKGYLSLDHFMVDLAISKNTAMRTITHLRQQLPLELELTYSRTAGYDLAGKEWEIRKYMISTVITIRRMYNGELFLRKYIGASNEKIRKYQSILTNAEELLHVQFTDDRIDHLPYILLLIARRIKQGRVIQESFHIANNMLSDTQEYMVASKLFDNWQVIPDQEKLFITLQLLTTNIFSGDILTEKLSQNLSEIVDTCLRRFERRACVILNQKEELKQRLLLHLRPAYYRMKYHLNLKMNVEPMQMDERQQALKQIVYESFQPLQTFIGEQIPEEEFEFIAIFVFSGLSEKPMVEEKKRAVVVCKSGIIISQTLHTFLQKIFPEFDFLPPCSLRDYRKTAKDATVIFSTVPINDQTSVYLVKPLMTQGELQTLRTKVLSDLSGVIPVKQAGTSVESILKVIEKYADIEKKQQLEAALIQLFHVKEEELSVEKIGLAQVLPLDHVQIVEELADYQTAIRLASRPLLSKGYITEQYVNQMIENHEYDDPYILLGDDVAIPHAMPEYGVKELGVSLLYIRRGVEFARNQPMHFVFVLALVDKEKHIEMLYEIMNLAEDNELLNEMKNVRNEQQLYDLVVQEKE